MADRDDDVEGSDPQDIAEVFDEDNTNIESMRQGRRDDAEQFEDLVDVFDSTRAVGDADDDDEDYEADDLDDEDLKDEDLDDEEEADEDDDEVDLDPRDRDPTPEDDQPDDDEIDGLESYDPDEVELEYAGDLTDVANAGSSAGGLEADELSDDDLRELHYKEDAPLNTEDRTPTPSETERKEAEQKAREEHRKHDERLDEGVEETFPASDPVAVKHIS